MKRKTVITMAAAFSLALAAAVPAFAQTPEPTTTPAPQPTQAPLTATTPLFASANFLVNVRSGPGTQYTILGKARSGDALDITGQLADGTWLRVNFNGQEGWVLASLFNPTGDLTTAPEAVAGPSAVLRNASNGTTGTSSESTAEPGGVFGTTTGNVNLRSVPSTQGDVLVIIPFSTDLTATGRTSNSNWVQVNYNGQTGWITSAVYSVSRGNVVSLPIFDETGNQVPATAVPTARPTAEATTSP